jgi:hypothetical protein
MLQLRDYAHDFLNYAILDPNFCWRIHFVMQYLTPLTTGIPACQVMSSTVPFMCASYQNTAWPFLAVTVTFALCGKMRNASTAITNGRKQQQQQQQHTQMKSKRAVT